MKILLRWLARLLPGDFLKTFVYRNLLYRPRKLLRTALTRFYRIDHIYEVLEEARDRYAGEFSILEFGTAAGYSFRKMLYATRYAGMDDRVTVHAFDTFEGLPSPDSPKDRGLVLDEYREGDYRADVEELKAYCGARYSNFRIHEGRFSETLSPELLATLTDRPPILIWIDCDYYSSARTVMERLAAHLPNGCVIYFDDYHFNYGSRLTGEARLVHEINRGLLGDEIELVLDRKLAWDSRRVYRFVRMDGRTYEPARTDRPDATARRPTSDSPLP